MTIHEAESAMQNLVALQSRIEAGEAVDLSASIFDCFNPANLSAPEVKLRAPNLDSFPRRNSLQAWREKGDL